MTTTDIKAETLKMIDDLPDEKLLVVLDFLKELRLKSSEKDKSDKFIKKVFEEDRELFRRLAE